MFSVSFVVHNIVRKFDRKCIDNFDVCFHCCLFRGDLIFDDNININGILTLLSNGPIKLLYVLGTFDKK